MANFLPWLGICAGIMIVIIFCGVTIYNNLQRFHKLIPEAHSNIDILLMKRRDLITELIKVVKSYGIHEKEIFINVSGDFADSKTSVGAPVISRLASLRMQFPALKADNLYGDLISQLSDVETEIQVRRERLNARVRAYNTYISQFPNNIFASQFNFQSEDFAVTCGVDSLNKRPEI